MNYVSELENQIEKLQEKLVAAEKFHEWRDNRLHTKPDFSYRYKIKFTSMSSYYFIIARSQAKLLLQQPRVFSNNIEDVKNIIEFHEHTLDRDFASYYNRAVPAVKFEYSHVLYAVLDLYFHKQLEFPIKSITLYCQEKT